MLDHETFLTNFNTNSEELQIITQVEESCDGSFDYFEFFTKINLQLPNVTLSNILPKSDSYHVIIKIISEF